MMGHPTSIEDDHCASAPCLSASTCNLDRRIQHDLDRPWRVLHTRPRQEKAVGEVLRAAGLPHFLPTVKETKVYGHRKRVVERPLFPSYVFLQGAREDAWFAVGTKRVAQVIDAPDQGQLVHELEQIRLALQGQGVLDPYPFLQAGRLVRVRSGPFKGVEGVVDVRRQQDRLILKVNALGRAVGLEIDAGLLEPVE